MSIAYKKNGVWVTASGTPPIDNALSATSENAVQNKIVKDAIDGKANLIVQTTDPGEGSALASGTLLVVV